MKLAAVTSDLWDFILDYPEKTKQGILVHYKGVPYPRRAYYDKLDDPNHFRRALEALGRVKKYLFALTFLSSVVFPRTLSIKKWDGFLLKLYQSFWWQLDEFYLDDDEWSVPVWEIGKIVKGFLATLGFCEEVCVGFAKVIMAFLEYDNAYRYRLQDLIGAVPALLFYINPSLFAWKALKVYKSREELMGAAEKINKIGYLVYILFKLPKFKRAWVEAVREVDVAKIYLDVNDKYYTSFWRGYNFGGQDFDTRYQFFLNTHKNGFPPFKKRRDPEETAKFLLGE